MKKSLSLILSMILMVSTISIPMNIFASNPNNSDDFALVVKNGVKFTSGIKGETSRISRGDALVLGGNVVLRDRSCLQKDNKIYYKPGVSFETVDLGSGVTDPSKYTTEFTNDYAIENIKTPVFNDKNLVQADDITIINKDVIINSDSYIKNVNITKVGNLVFDVPAEKTLFVKIDNLTFNGPGTLGRGSVYVNGGGTVYLQVDNILGDGSKFINYPSNYIPFDTYTLRNDNKLVMNVKNSSNSTLTNLLAEADVYFDNSITLDGSFKVCGNVIASGDVLYKGTLDTTDKQFNVIGQVYAPNGHVSLNRQAR
ncbi:MAG: hypothetical protein RSA27_03370, partial [Oscillospiraceae bacterium]